MNIANCDKSPILAKRQRIFRKLCCVPRCNSSSRNGNLLFFPVPKTESRFNIFDIIETKTWRRPHVTSIQSGIYICENHYQLQEDVKFFNLYDPNSSENKSKNPLRLKENVLPHIFPDTTINPPKHPEYVLAAKRLSSYGHTLRTTEFLQKLTEQLVEAGFFHIGDSNKVVCFCCGGHLENFQEEHDSPWEIHAKKFPSCEFLLLVKGQPFVTSCKNSSNLLQVFQTAVHEVAHNDPVLVAEERTINIQHSQDENMVQTQIQRDFMHLSSTSHHDVSGSCTEEKAISNSSKTVTFCECKKSRHSRHEKAVGSPGILKSSPSITTSRSTSDTEFTPGTTTSQSSTETCAVEFEKFDTELTNQNICSLMISLSLKNSKVCLGIDSDKIGIVKLLTNYVKRKYSERDIIIVLRRIKLFETFEVLAIHFGLSCSQVNRIYNDVLPILAKCFRQYIFKSDPKNVYLNLPASFRANYYMVSEILDCFETGTQKPGNPILQTMSWSDYKQGNTVKYLISVQPCGHICYISKGYGGRVSDMQLTRSCGYLDTLKKGMVALADRGFKHLETDFADRECILLRPPSVSATDKLSEEESLLTKQIAALRIHVERVIGRLREFSSLAPHAGIDHSMLGMQDEVVIVACGLVNLQRKITQY